MKTSMKTTNKPMTQYVKGHEEVRIKENIVTLQSGHLLYHYEANNGQAGVGFLINKKCNNNNYNKRNHSDFQSSIICFRVAENCLRAVLPRHNIHNNYCTS